MSFESTDEFLEHHARITGDTEDRILQEASESSYQRGGANASINGDCISKEAVMNKLHKLEFPALKAGEKKERKTIYIDADKAVHTPKNALSLNDELIELRKRVKE